MSDFIEKMIPIAPSKKFAFKCRQCGACCRHVKESVPLEPMDAFYLAKYLRSQGEPVTCVDDVLVQYADPVLLDKSGFSIFMLKTTGSDDACIFLKDGRCAIHAAKPKACRIYPASFWPKEGGAYQYFLSTEQPHHYKGPQTTVKRWIQKYSSSQERDVLKIDAMYVNTIAQLLKKATQKNAKRAVALFLHYRYYDYNLERAFLPQFECNTKKLLAALESIADIDER